MFEFNFFYLNLKNKMGNNRVNKSGATHIDDKISDEEFRQLSISSGYSLEKIKFYYQSFINDCPNGKLSK